MCAEVTDAPDDLFVPYFALSLDLKRSSGLSENYWNRSMEKLPFRRVCIVLVRTEPGIRVFVTHANSGTIKWTQAGTRGRDEVTHAHARHHPATFIFNRELTLEKTTPHITYLISPELRS